MLMFGWRTPAVQRLQTTPNGPMDAHANCSTCCAKDEGRSKIPLQRTFVQSSTFCLYGDLCAKSFDPACAVARLKCLNMFDGFVIDNKSMNITISMFRICEMYAPCMDNVIHNNSISEHRSNNSTPSITLLTWSLRLGNGMNSVNTSVDFNSKIKFCQLMSFLSPYLFTIVCTQRILPTHTFWAR